MSISTGQQALTVWWVYNAPLSPMLHSLQNILCFSSMSPRYMLSAWLTETLQLRTGIMDFISG